MINLILILTAIGLLVYLFLKWVTSNHDVFKKQGLKYVKPLPLIGNSQYIFSRGRGLVDRILSAYDMFPNEKVYGLFEFTTPLYFLRCPELVKQITIKDFAYFQDHKSFVDASHDDFFGSVLFAMKGKQWREMRSSLSPLFTGRKMRTMLEFITKCANQLVEHVQEDFNKNGLKSYKMKDLCSRYTNDVISTCAFGVECDSLKHPKNEIYVMGQDMLKFQKPSQGIKFLLMRSSPRLTRMLGLKVVDDNMRTTFKDLIINTMEIRKKEGIVRPDMIDLLMKLRDGQQLTKDQETEIGEIDQDNNFLNGDVKHTWKDMELVAQCFLFFLGGFDTSSTVMTFVAYELAINPDIQEKLIQTIDETNESLEGSILTYETLQKMKYLDMVIAESLRKWPPAIVTDRECVKTYTYEDENGLKFTVEKGDMIWVPIYGFHMDPTYFPNPEKFDPERFSDENKANIDMNTYLPFGVGPRNCIGLRFALMEIKALLYSVLLNFRFKVCKETQVPLKLKKSFFGLMPEKEIELYIEPRNDKKSI